LAPKKPSNPSWKCETRRLGGPPQGIDCKHACFSRRPYALFLCISPPHASVHLRYSHARGFHTINFLRQFNGPSLCRLVSCIKIRVRIHSIRAPTANLGTMFGTRTALYVSCRKTDVRRVCVCNRMFSPVQMAPRLIRSWLEEGEDLRLILEISRCLFSF